jgi:hypothetical protein
VCVANEHYILHTIYDTSDSYSFFVAYFVSANLHTCSKCHFTSQLHNVSNETCETCGTWNIFLISFQLQAVQIHSGNGVKLLEA